MMGPLRQLKSFVWVIYPAAVAALIFISASQLQAGGASKLSSIWQKQDQAAVAEQKLAVLQKKLTALQAVDATAVNSDLAWSLTVMPAGKQVWVMLGELNNAASAASAEVTSYNGTVGNVDEASASAKDLPPLLDVEFGVDNFDQLRTLLTTLEKSLPLLDINSVDYAKGKAKVTVTGAFAGWGKIDVQAESPLPAYQAKLESLKARLQDFEVLSSENPMTGSGSAVNPF